MGRHRAIKILRRALLGVVLLLAPGCGGPPQVLDDEDAYRAVDALWTAVTSRKVELLDASSARLTQLQSEGKLSEAGMASLKRIIDQAKAGNWQPAAKDLKKFIQGQRRTQKHAE